jgi:hypothetical protein
MNEKCQKQSVLLYIPVDVRISKSRGSINSIGHAIKKKKWNERNEWNGKAEMDVFLM